MSALLPAYPETVFRFRNYSPLSLKELQYGEIFFVAKDELNDPYDTKSPAMFEADVEIYRRLIYWVLGNTLHSGIEVISKAIKVDEIAFFLAKEPLLQDDLVALLASVEFESLVRKSFGVYSRTDLVPFFITKFQQIVINGGGLCYVASFSKNNNDPVMWSHYANHHKGYCLCFSIANNVLKRDRLFEKGHFFSDCKFEEVNYESKNVTTNGYMMFPRYVYGKEVSESERQAYWDLRRKSYLTKFSSWSYEQEVRILVDDWFDIRSSKDCAIKKTIADRIFYYDRHQLTGIVFGARMSANERTEIRTIVNKLRSDLLIRDNVAVDGRFSGAYLPIFIFYQAKENPSEFKMTIEAIDGLDATNRFFSLDKLKEKQKELDDLLELYRKQDEYRKAKKLPGPIGVNGTFLTDK